MRKGTDSKTYTFNDFPLNMMSWIGQNYIEAQFNVGNPKKHDKIIYGKTTFVITKVKKTGPLHCLSVKLFGK